MYTQQEASFLRQRFWTSFGKYISPIPSSTGEKMNWINYRTGIKFIHFKMDATAEYAYIAIEITHKDPSIQELYFNHFKTFAKALEESVEEKWTWQPNSINESGDNIACIYTKLKKVNVYDEKDWPQMISFLKKRIIELDRFWNEYKEIFEMLN